MIGSVAVAQPGPQAREVRRYNQEVRKHNEEVRKYHDEVRKYHNEVKREARRAERDMNRAERDMEREMKRIDRRHGPHDVRVVSFDAVKAGGIEQLNFRINYDRLLLDPDEMMVVIPTVEKGDRNISFSAVVFAGEKAMKKVNRNYEEFVASIGMRVPYETVVMTRDYMRQQRRAMRNGEGWSMMSEANVDYSENFPYQTWMDGATIRLHHFFVRGNRTVYDYVIDLGVISNPMPPQVMFVVPEVEVVKARSESMTSRLVFRVDKTTIDAGLDDNAVELQKIYSFTDKLAGNKDIKITAVHMTGYASPEGPYQHNADLARGRVEALQDMLLKKYPGVNKDLYHVTSVAEDWKSVRSWVAASDIKYRQEVLDIIDSVDPDKRDAKIRALDNGATYKMLLREVYPDLRRVEYKIDFTVMPFTVEKGKQVMKENPQYLSLNEFYQIAMTYPNDSPEYAEVFATAVRFYPEDPVANNNMAAVALMKNDLKSAEAYLEKVAGSPKAKNNMGVLKALQGDFRSARKFFEEAVKAGSREAQYNLENLESLRSRK